MQKKKILEKLIEKLNSELKEVKASYASTKDMVQKGDLKSDGKYDTRATEANYLADGQRQRISDLEQELIMLEETSVRDLKETDEVCIGALVNIEYNGVARDYFISPTAGGTMLNIDGKVIMVISVFSPIGSEALGNNVGESFEVEIQGSFREYVIKSVK